MRRHLLSGSFTLLLPLLLGGCVVNMGAGAGGASSAPARSSEKNETPEFIALPAEKIPGNASGLTVAYGESRVTDVTSKDYPDVIVRGHHPPAELQKIRITAVTAVREGRPGQPSQIQIYNAGVESVDIVIRKRGFDAEGILRGEKEETKQLRARDIVIPEREEWTMTPGSRVQYTIIVE